MAVAFIAFSGLWLLADHRVPGGGDAGRHLATTLFAADLLGEGDVAGLFELGPNGPFFYPPLVHWIGAVAPALGLPALNFSTFALNLVFVPLLVAGCFGVGRRVYGPTAGLLAVVFALGAPMVLSMFHAFLLDAPLTAAVAIAVWALLASERFTRRWESIAVGALIALALLIKPTAAIFLLGPIAVILIQGGWRQWRNLALAVLAAAVVAAPYYAIHFSEVMSLSEQTTSSGQLTDPGLAFDPSAAYDRFTLDNFLYYGWVGINIQYFLPLAALFAIGFVTAIGQFRARPDVVALVVGVLISYLTLTFVISIRDPRYTLPMLVFVAVLATGWIAELRRPLVRAVAIAALSVAVIVNVASAATESAPNLRFKIPGTASDDLSQPGVFTVFDQRGSTVGTPRTDRFWERLLSAARDQGVDEALFEVVEPAFWGSEPVGFGVFADEYGIAEVSFGAPGSKPDLRINTWVTPSGRRASLTVGAPRPCGIVAEGSNAEGTAPVPVRVAVRLRNAEGELERWCEF